MGSDGTLPGLVTYGKDAKVIYNIGKVTSREVFITNINGVQDPGEGDTVLSAVGAVQDVLFRSRSGVPKAFVLLLDKDLSDGDAISKILVDLKSKGVKITIICTKKGDSKCQGLPDIDSFIFPDTFPELVRKIIPLVTDIKEGMFKTSFLVVKGIKWKQFFKSRIFS